MAESTFDARGLPKRDAYLALERQLDAVMEGVEDRLTLMVTLNALLHHGFGHLWTGFYRVAEPGKLLRVGPYQGTLGCLEIPFGKGVCGTSAQRGEAVIVKDVQAFPGHISCDARSRSEIVVPVFGPGKALLAVLDIDSAHLAAFDEQDARGLERLLQRFETMQS
jgi:GAF domain-containing protein